MASKLPATMKTVVVKQAPTAQKPLYHAAALQTRPVPALRPGQVLVQMRAVAFNHRDVWIRKGQYPAIKMDGVFGSDGAGTVIASYRANDPLLNKRVFLTPMRGWETHPDAPESKFGILGGVHYPDLGTFSEYVAVERDQVVPTPQHLTDVQMAAWPLGGLTAWRASVVNAQVEQGQNVLITGIGGGVALLALQICIAKGANVYVTSGSPEKLQKALELGAKGGVNYKEKDWASRLQIMLGKTDRPFLDSVIDSAGGSILGRVGKVLKQGGRVVCYGMTASNKIPFTMKTVLANQKLIGSTMGSHKDMIDSTNFLAEHKIIPVISHVIDGLENAEEGFEIMKNGDQFGKIVIKIDSSIDSPEEQAPVKSKL